MHNAYHEILNEIKNIYKQYAEKVTQLQRDSQKKSHIKTSQQQVQFIKKLKPVAENLKALTQQAQKSENMKQTQLKSFLRVIVDCNHDIEKILKSSIMFKVDTEMIRLIAQTDNDIRLLRKDLPNAKDNTILCCGTNGIPPVKAVLQNFHTKAEKWKLLATIEPKDSVEKFVGPDFDKKKFTFIENILTKHWPQETTKTIVKMVGKQGKLGQANQLIYGINKEKNVKFGLKIYEEQADKNNDTAACAYLGRVYEEGVLLQRDTMKAIKYYERAMNGQPYAKYRFAKALIRGQFSQQGPTTKSIEQAFDMLEKLVSGSSPFPEAMLDLGQFYERGYFSESNRQLFSKPKNLKLALNYYNEAAHCFQMPRAYNNLGVLYCQNLYIDHHDPSKINKSETNAEKNIRKALENLETACSYGYGPAFYNLGVLYQKGTIIPKDGLKALKLFYEGALKRDYKCKIRFAFCLINRTSFQKEKHEDQYRLAIRWLQEVINKLNIKQHYLNSEYQCEITAYQKATAVYCLGLMHQYGFGTDSNPKRAFQCFLQSSKQDYPAAFNKLGDCYFSGYGTKTNKQKALQFYHAAAQQKNSQALVNLGSLYLKGIPGVIDKQHQRALQCFRQATQLGNTDAMIHLSVIYRKMDKNEEFSKQLLIRAAKNKNSKALYMLKQLGYTLDQSILVEHYDNQLFTPADIIDLNHIMPLIPNKSKKNH